MLPILLFCLFSQSQAFRIPPGVEKISNTIIRNDTRYHQVLVHGTGLLQLVNTTTLDSWPDTRIVILAKTNVPKWATTENFLTPDINIIDTDMVRIYFAARENKTKGITIGVAFATALNIYPRDYGTLNEPLLVPYTTDNFTLPSLIVSGDNLYLTFVHESSQTAADVHVGVLSDDGLSVTEIHTKVLQLDLPWESKTINNQWGFEKNGYIYLMYETAGCLGVARHRSDVPLGQFEKMSLPLIAAGKSIPPRHHLQAALHWQPNGWPMIQL